MGIYDGLVLWLPLDEGGGSVAYDKSAYGNDGTIYGASWVNGKYGKALSFDEINDCVEVADASSLDIAGAHTISMCINPKRTGVLEYFFGKSDGDTYIAYVFRFNVNNSLAFGFYDGAWKMVTSTGFSRSADVWYHIVGVYDLANLKLYINGVVNNSVIQTAPIPTGTGTLDIGKYSYSDDFFCQCIIDEVRVYNRALTEPEISELHNYRTDAALYYYYLGTFTKPANIPSVPKADPTKVDWTMKAVLDEALDRKIMKVLQESKKHR